MKNQRRHERSRVPASPVFLAALEPRILFSASLAVLTLTPDGGHSASVSNPVPALDAYEGIPVPADPTSTAIPVTVQLFDTATAIQVGDAITITALVTTADGQPLDGERIELWNASPTGYVAASAEISGGIATFTWIPATGGLHSLSAILAAQGGYASASSAPLELNVYRRAAALSLRANTVGDSTRLMLTASTLQSLSFAPDGIVDFYDGTHFLDSVALGGSVTDGISLSPGEHELRAHYRGSGAFFSADVVEDFNVPEPAPPVAGKSPAPVGVIPSAVNFIAAFSSASAAPIAAAEVPVTGSGSSILSAGAAASSDSALAAAQNPFGLVLPEFRQFYEMQWVAAGAGESAPGAATPNSTSVPPAGPALTPPDRASLPAAAPVFAPPPSPTPARSSPAAFEAAPDGRPRRST